MYQLDLGPLVNVEGNLTANTPHFMLLCFTDEVSEQNNYTGSYIEKV